MASEHRPTPPDLTESQWREALFQTLSDAPWSFGFFRALRLIECAHAEQPRIGEAHRAGEDPIRLGQQPSMAFAPATLAELRRREDGLPPLLLVQFLGLFGPNGPLPLHLTELARDRERKVHDQTLARFADIFHHRALSFFYQAWAQARPTVSFDRPEQDRFGDYLGSLAGLGIPEMHQRDAVPDVAKLHYAGHLASQTRHSCGLASIIGDYLRLPVVVDEFVGQWLDLSPDQQWRLGSSPESGAFGISTVLGARIWDQQFRFRIRIGPLSLKDYEHLLPGGETLPDLVALIRGYVGDEFDWDLNLVLAKDQIPPLALGPQARLGWTTWSGERPTDEDADDLCLEPMRHGIRGDRRERRRIE